MRDKMFCKNLYFASSHLTRKIWSHNLVLKIRYDNIQMHCSQHNPPAESKPCFSKTKGCPFR